MCTLLAPPPYPLFNVIIQAHMATWPISPRHSVPWLYYIAHDTLAWLLWPTFPLVGIHGHRG